MKEWKKRERERERERGSCQSAVELGKCLLCKRMCRHTHTRERNEIYLMLKMQIIYLHALLLCSALSCSGERRGGKKKKTNKKFKEKGCGGQWLNWIEAINLAVSL